MSSTHLSGTQSTASTASDNTAATNDRTGTHAVLDDQSGQTASGAHQKISSSTSSGSGKTSSSNSASKADTATVKFTATDLNQSTAGRTSAGDGDTLSSDSGINAGTSTVKRTTADLGQSTAGHASAGDGDTLSFNAASTGEAHGTKAWPAHDWSAGEIAWAVDFARQAVGHMVAGRALAVHDSHGGTLKQAGNDPTQVFSSWSGKAGSNSDLAWVDGATSDHAGKTSFTSTATVDHVATEQAQTVDILQGHGLTGFEI